MLVSGVDCRGSSITGTLVIAVSFCTTVRSGDISVASEIGEGVASGSSITASVLITSRVWDGKSSVSPGIV